MTALRSLSFPNASAVPVTDQLWAWYKSDTGITGTTTVTAWADQSGNARDLISETGKEPMVILNALNSKPSVGLNNKIAHMATSGAFPDTEEELSVYVVAKQKVGAGALADNQGMFLTTGANSLTLRRIFTGGVNNNVYSQFKLTTLNHVAADDVFYTISLVLSNNDNKMYLNGALSNSNTDGTFDIGSDSLHVFANESGGGYGNKEIVEILIYTSKHSNTDRQSVESYLRTEYAHY